MQQGALREDLLYRLNVITIKLPALRDHRDDIPLLVQHMIEELSKRHNKTAQLISPDAMESLFNSPWPGNVRELENLVQRSFALRGKLKLSASDVFEQTVESAEAAPTQVGHSVSAMERKLIMATLDQTNGNRTHAAKLLGISLRTLRNKLREYRVEEVAAV